MKRYRALGETVLVRRDPEAAQGDILMPHNVKKKPKSGVILSIGPNVTYNVAIDERIFFNEYAGYFLETTEDFEESDLIVLRQDELLVVEEEVEDDSAE